MRTRIRPPLEQQRMEILLDHSEDPAIRKKGEHHEEIEGL